MLFCLFVYLIDSIRVIEIAVIELSLLISHHAMITFYMTLFLVTVLTDILVILTILSLQSIHLSVVRFIEF